MTNPMTPERLREIAETIEVFAEKADIQDDPLYEIDDLRAWADDVAEMQAWADAVSRVDSRLLPGGLRLYLWPNHQPDWTLGVAFALAGDEEEARRLIRAHPDNILEPEGAPEIHDEPFGFSRYGGG